MATAQAQQLLSEACPVLYKALVVRHNMHINEHCNCCNLKSIPLPEGTVFSSAFPSAIEPWDFFFKIPCKGVIIEHTTIYHTLNYINIFMFN